ncbi:MAG: eight-cysteine-cluster domain-containing protein [Candidatus Anstonellaceae archaeon]
MGVKIFFIIFLFLAGCIFQNKEVQVSNPAATKCIEDGAKYEILKLDGGEVGVCIFENLAKCEEWAYFMGECDKFNPNFCLNDLDCSCGKNKLNQQCFIGQREFVNELEQCPDFCTGIANNLKTMCINFSCKLVQKNFEKDKSKFCGYGVGECKADSDCIVGGCSGQICHSKYLEDFFTTCEYKECYDAKRYGLSCKCVENKCKWD